MQSTQGKLNFFWDIVLRLKWSVPFLSVCTSGNVDGNGVGACSGDSGGPVCTVTTGADPVLVGIISAGFGCSGTKPTLNTRITSYLTWINANKI